VPEREQKLHLQYSDEEVWSGVTAKGVRDQHTHATMAGGVPKEGAPADEGARPLITRFSLARARHEVCVDYMRRAAERAESLEEENEHLKTAGERLQTENEGLLQELLRLRKEAEQWQCLQSTSPQSPGGWHFRNSPCFDARCQPLEAGLTTSSVPLPPPADGHRPRPPPCRDGASVGSLMAEIWLDAPPETSCGDNRPRKRSGELSPPSSRAACGVDAEAEQAKPSVGSDARLHRGIRLGREREVGPQQRQQQQQHASSGTSAAASRKKAATRKVVAPGGVLGRLAAMQRARDSEARRERAALRIQIGVRALLLRPASSSVHHEACSSQTLTEQMPCFHVTPHFRGELQRLRREQATYAGGQPVARPLQSPRRSLGSDALVPATSCQARPGVQSKPQDTSRAGRMPPWAPASRRPREAAAARQIGAKQGATSCGNCSGVEESATSMPPAASNGQTVELHEKSAVAAPAITQQLLPYAQVGRGAEVKRRQWPLRSGPEGSHSASRARFILVGIVDDPSAGT